MRYRCVLSSWRILMAYGLHATKNASPTQGCQSSPRHALCPLELSHPVRRAHKRNAHHGHTCTSERGSMRAFTRRTRASRKESRCAGAFSVRAGTHQDRLHPPPNNLPPVPSVVTPRLTSAGDGPRVLLPHPTPQERGKRTVNRRKPT